MSAQTDNTRREKIELSRLDWRDIKDSVLRAHALAYASSEMLKLPPSEHKDADRKRASEATVGALCYELENAVSLLDDVMEEGRRHG